MKADAAGASRVSGFIEQALGAGGIVIEARHVICKSPMGCGQHA